MGGITLCRRGVALFSQPPDRESCRNCIGTDLCFESWFKIALLSDSTLPVLPMFPHFSPMAAFLAAQRYSCEEASREFDGVISCRDDEEMWRGQAFEKRRERDNEKETATWQKKAICGGRMIRIRACKAAWVRTCNFQLKRRSTLHTRKKKKSAFAKAREWADSGLPPSAAEIPIHGSRP